VEVVSISLDHERSALTKFLLARPLPWPQVYFDPSESGSFKDHPAFRYDIQAIPCLLVIDREGKLVDRDVRGKEVQDAIVRALGEPVVPTLRERLTELGAPLLQVPIYSLLEAPRWLLLACGMGGAMLGMLVQMGIRRALQVRSGVAKGTGSAN
jgi:hypothetical protein